MINFILKNLSVDGRILTGIIAALLVSWVLWVSGSVTKAESFNAKIAVQQDALKESTNLKLDRMNEKLDFIIRQQDNFFRKELK